MFLNDKTFKIYKYSKRMVDCDSIFVQGAPASPLCCSKL